MIKYIDRYSSTDELDDKGRWARIAIFRDIQIAWISKHKDEFEDGFIYFVDNKFPTMYNDSARECKVFKTLKDAKEFVFDKWNWFVDNVK